MLNEQEPSKLEIYVGSPTKHAKEARKYHLLEPVPMPSLLKGPANPTCVFFRYLGQSGTVYVVKVCVINMPGESLRVEGLGGEACVCV